MAEKNLLKGETMEQYLNETQMLDFSHADIAKLIEARGWLF